VCDEGSDLCEAAGPGAWWDYAWLFRKAITIDPANVGADLTDFPVLIDLTDADVAANAQSSGDDLVFTDSNGVQLSHEIEFYDTGTGHVIAWVSVPDLSSTEDTLLYLYFGNSSAMNQEDVEGTWDSNYVMVQHLDETSGTHVDSTVYNNDSNDVLVTDQDAAGSINGADEFNGADDYVRVPDAATLQFGEGSFTAEAWIHPHSIPDTGGARIVNNRGTGVGGSYPGWHFKIKDDTGNWRFGDSGIDDATGPLNYKPYDGIATYPYNAWYQVVMVYDADTELRFYVNGASDGTPLSVGPYGSITNSLPTVIGASLADQGVEGADDKQFFDGFIDEVRLSDTVRSAEWIAASYSNQNAPGGFYSVGDLELSTGAPTVSFPEPADSAIDVSITLTELRFTLNDPDMDSMDYTVTTTPDIGSDSVSGVANGTYSVAVSGLAYETTYQWDISVDDGSGVTNRSYSFTTEMEPVLWWDTLAFTDFDNVQLSHEIELYDNGTGHVIAWVRVPDLSSTEATVLYLYFGNSGASNQEDVEGTWDSNYRMVQHLDETTGTHFDSTINDNDGTPVDVFLQDATGKIDGADEFDDPLTPAEIDVGTDASLDVFGPAQDFSIFMWVKRDAINEVEGFFSSGSSNIHGIYFGSAFNNTDDLKFMSINQSVEIESTTDVIGDTAWHLVGVTADRDDVLQFWVDGVSVHSESIAASSAQDWNRSDDTYKIGTDRSEASPMDGIIDEVRVSDIVRGSGWISTSYTNQNNPSAFYLLGSIEAEPDTDGDGMPDPLDNCPNYSNGPLQGTCTEDDGVNLIVRTGQFCTVNADCDPGEFCEKTQADNYPPGGNGIGDACDCEADFDCDIGGLDVDAINVEQFLFDFGRSVVFDPCTNERFCYGDFDCNGNVDADDIPKLLEDFGRTVWSNPCPAPPACVVGDWCVYP
jgi:hypothetical protein